MFSDALISNLTRAVHEDPETRLATRHATFSSLLEFGPHTLLMKAREGDVKFISSPTTDEPWDFSVRGSEEALRHLREAATPLTNHPIGMATQGVMAVGGGTPTHLRFEGNYQKLYANLAAVCAVLAQLRHIEG